MDKLVRVVGVSYWPAIFAGIAMETSSFLLLEVEHGRLSQALLLFWLLGLAAFIQMAMEKRVGGSRLVLGSLYLVLL